MAEPSLEGLSILVVGESSDERAELMVMLEGFGFANFRNAGSGTEALQRLRGGRFDLLLIDAMLPVLDGFEVVLSVRRDPESPNPFLPTVMMLPSRDRSLVLKARDVGVNRLLLKPVEAEPLRRALVLALGDPREFVREDTYAGPDRRIEDRGPLGVERRR